MTRMRTLPVGPNIIGEGEPCWVVAEISANHNQSLDRARALVREARAAGANAVKLQTYTADTMTLDCDSEWFRIPDRGLWAGRRLHDLYQEAHTPWEWHAPLRDLAVELGMEFFSTPFDASAVDFLEDLGVRVYKVASFEVVDLPLLRRIGQTGKPVIMSTGMATLAEISEAVVTLRDAGATDVALLKCTSAYPASPADMNLRTIPHLAQTFDCVVGLSDHTLGSGVAVAGMTLGAAIIEKHFTHRRSDGGPDAAFSMEPEEFAAMVGEIRRAEQALGEVRYERTADEKDNLSFRRSLFVVKDIKAGEPFTSENVRSIRPAGGLPPRDLELILGRRADRDLPRGTPLSWGLIGALGE